MGERGVGVKRRYGGSPVEYWNAQLKKFSAGRHLILPYRRCDVLDPGARAQGRMTRWEGNLVGNSFICFCRGAILAVKVRAFKMSRRSVPFVACDTNHSQFIGCRLFLSRFRKAI